MLAQENTMLKAIKTTPTASNNFAHPNLGDIPNNVNPIAQITQANTAISTVTKTCVSIAAYNKGIPESRAYMHEPITMKAKRLCIYRPHNLKVSKVL